MKSSIWLYITTLVLALSTYSPLYAQHQEQSAGHEEVKANPEKSGSIAEEGGGPEKFNVKEMTMHHLLDNYDWEIVKMGGGTEVVVRLPRIFLHDGKISFFPSTTEAIKAGWIEEHHYNEEAAHGALLSPEAHESLHPLETSLANTTNSLDRDNIRKEISKVSASFRPWDFSITKNVVFLLVAALLLLVIFTAVARGYKKNVGKSPKGIQSFFEPIVVFVRDEIAKPNIPVGYERFLPLLLTLFFFIWLLNLLGMIPGSGNVTGNISVSLALSLVTLFAVNVFAKRGYWKHIFAPPVPHAIKLIMVPLEILSIFTKPFALTVRLFANITGGHVIVVSLVSLIFIFGKLGENAAMGWGVGVISTLFVVAISLLELFVAALQAFVFTMLTAVFIGQAVAQEEHH